MKAVLDLGDIVGVTGGMRRTDKGELSVQATDIQVAVPASTCRTCDFSELHAEGQLRKLLH